MRWPASSSRSSACQRFVKVSCVRRQKPISIVLLFVFVSDIVPLPVAEALDLIHERVCRIAIVFNTD